MRSPVLRCLAVLVLLGTAATGAPCTAGEDAEADAGKQDAGKQDAGDDAGPAYEVAHRFEGHASIVRSVAFRPGSTMFASGGSDRTVRLWDAATGKAVARQELPRGG